MYPPSFPSRWTVASGKPGQLNHGNNFPSPKFFTISSSTWKAQPALFHEQSLTLNHLTSEVFLSHFAWISWIWWKARRSFSRGWSLYLFSIVIWILLQWHLSSGDIHALYICYINFTDELGKHSLSLLCRWGNGSTEMIYRLPSITQEVSDRARNRNHISHVLCRRISLCPCPVTEPLIQTKTPTQDPLC